MAVVGQHSVIYLSHIFGLKYFFNKKAKTWAISWCPWHELCSCLEQIYSAQSGLDKSVCWATAKRLKHSSMRHRSPHCFPSHNRGGWEAMQLIFPTPLFPWHHSEIAALNEASPAGPVKQRTARPQILQRKCKCRKANLSWWLAGVSSATGSPLLSQRHVLSKGTNLGLKGNNLVHRTKAEKLSVRQKKV